MKKHHRVKVTQTALLGWWAYHCPGCLRRPFYATQQRAFLWAEYHATPANAYTQ